MLVLSILEGDAKVVPRLNESFDVCVSLNPRWIAEPGAGSFALSWHCSAAFHLPAQDSWSVVGPDGGDARAFAAVPGHPNHLYLGTTNSWLYESLDSGASWHRLAKLDPTDGFVLDSVVVDSAHPSTLYVGAWKDSNNGGLWISHDGGHTWMEPGAFKGKAVHALAQARSESAHPDCRYA